jgi:hypothetical protein
MSQTFVVVTASAKEDEKKKKMRSPCFRKPAM